MEEATLPRRPGLRLLAALAIAAALGACSGQAGGIGFVARGEAAPLPRARSFLPASAKVFNSVIVGQRGRPVVVNVWASWCGPCRVEAPLLARAARHYGDEVTFLGVNAQDSPAAAEKFAKRYGLGYPNLVDVDNSITRTLGFHGFPTTYIVDRRGRVVSSVVGGISEQTLAARLAQVLR